MSDTPRTDEAMWSELKPGGGVQVIVDAVFARQLERELATATKERDELAELQRVTLERYLTNAQKKIVAERDSLRQQLAESQADQRRLDWLAIEARLQDWENIVMHSSMDAEGIRAAIDAAMEEKQNNSHENS